MRNLEKAVEVPVGVDEYDFAAVAHEISVVLRCLITKGNIDLACQSENVDVCPGHSQLVLAKIFNISAQFFRRIALWIDCNHYHLHRISGFGFLQQTFELAD